MELKNLVVGPAGLGELLGKSEKTIRSDVYRRPETLPPPCRVRGSGSGPLWVVEDVIDWLRGHRVAEGSSYAAGSRRADEAQRVLAARRGKPSKREQVEAARLGISVPELRRQAAGPSRAAV